MKSPNTEPDKGKNSAASAWGYSAETNPWRVNTDSLVKENSSDREVLKQTKNRSSSRERADKIKDYEHERQHNQVKITGDYIGGVHETYYQLKGGDRRLYDRRTGQPVKNPDEVAAVNLAAAVVNNAHKKAMSVNGTDQAKAFDQAMRSSLNQAAFSRADVYQITSDYHWQNGRWEDRQNRPVTNQVMQAKIQLANRLMNSAYEDVQQADQPNSSFDAFLQRRLRILQNSMNSISGHQTSTTAEQIGARRNVNRQPNRRRVQLNQPDQPRRRNLEREQLAETNLATKTFDNVMNHIGTRQMDRKINAIYNRLPAIKKQLNKNPRQIIAEVAAEGKNSRRAANHAAELLSEGEVSEDVAKVWLDRTLRSEDESGSMYGSLVRYQPDKISPDNIEHNRQRYNRRLLNFAESRQNTVVQRRGKYELLPNHEQIMAHPDLPNDAGFLHVNIDKTGHINERCYISANHEGNTVDFLNAWQQAIDNSPLRDELYYKIGCNVPSGAEHGYRQRSDDLVIYKTDQIDNHQLQQLLQSFQDICQDYQKTHGESLLASPDHMPPSTSQFAPGMSIASEPEYANSVSNGEFSWNSFVDNTMRLSYQIAAAQMNEMPTTFSDKNWQARARDNFQQLMKLYNINPNTMLDNSQALPIWTKLNNL